ncbi:MAG: O-antigen ligase family protein [Candidatus Cloacimonadales bacterium]|nr:O-antigen ligase family protein [Candidatus Cloacimonadales bacterium]
MYIISSLLLFIILVIFMLQGARIAIMIMLVELFIYFIFFQKMKKKIFIIFILFFIFFFINAKFPNEVNLIKAKSIDEILSLSKEDESYRLESMETRIILIHHAIEMCFDSYLFGIGSGNFVENMNYERTITTSGIKDAHNFIFELVATNGFFLTLFFAISILVISIKLLIRARKVDNRNKYLLYSAGISLLFFIPASAMPSSILQYHCHWVVLSYIYSLYSISSRAN